MDRTKLTNFAKPYYDENQLLELDHAIDIATKAHKNQKRKNNDPYITHPLAVAHTLISWGMDIDSVIAGILHDTVEDTDLSLDNIESLFGQNVASLVDGVTKISKARSGMDNLENYLPETRDNLSKLLIATGQDIRVIIIKLADRLHNLSTLQHLSKAKQKKIARESLEVFGPMADRLGMGRVRTEIEELAFSFLDPTEYSKLKIQLKKKLGKSTKKLGEIRNETAAELKKQNITSEIDGRIKGIYSLHRKLAKVNGEIDDIYDLMALRIIVEKKEDCYLVLGILHSIYQPMINRIKDYIAVPKPNGYQSLHTTVVTPHKQIVEFQIRTYEMHEYAERGLAASFHYHDQKNSKHYSKGKKISNLPSNLQWINQLQEIADRLNNNEKISRDELNIDLFSDRIFVYSPKGDIFNLPEGSLPLDFAYLVHSDIAKHAYSFKVNGKIHPFDKPLQNGDVVEVVTRKLSLPKTDWKKLVKTSHARHKLGNQLRQIGVFDKIANAAININNKK